MFLKYYLHKNEGDPRMIQSKHLDLVFQVNEKIE